VLSRHVEPGRTIQPCQVLLLATVASEVQSKPLNLLNPKSNKVNGQDACEITVREIQRRLKEMQGAEISPTLISPVTDGVGHMEKPCTHEHFKRCTPWPTWTAHGFLA
jgi:hypothetical protein